MLGTEFCSSHTVNEYEKELEHKRLINDEFQTFDCNYKTIHEGKLSSDIR